MFEIVLILIAVVILGFLLSMLAEETDAYMTCMTLGPLVIVFGIFGLVTQVTGIADTGNLVAAILGCFIGIIAGMIVVILSGRLRTG